MYLAETGELVASGYARITIWNLRGENTAAPRVLSGHTNTVNCITLVNRRELASGSCDCTVRLWNIDTGECVRLLDSHTWGVISLLALPDSRLLSGSYDGSIKVWSLLNGTCLFDMLGHTKAPKSIFYMANTQELVTGAWDHQIRVWNMRTGRCLKTMQIHADEIRCLIDLPNGQLVSCSEDNTIKIWDLRGDSMGVHVRTLQQHNACVNYLAVVWREKKNV